jgi:uncharacterized LabA/DUF88 family protein
MTIASNNNYLFFDGSSLIAQIRTLWKDKSELESRKLNPLSLVAFLVSGTAKKTLVDFVTVRSHSEHFRESLPYKRAVFYFADGDSQIEQFLAMPDVTVPHQLRDINFKYCGRKLSGSAKYDKWVVDSVPEEFRERVSRAEKGVDLQICCDALRLAAAGHIDRLFLLTNDSDFVPLCDTLKSLGSNISLMRLPGRPVNSRLVAACDGYYEVPDTELSLFFAPKT